jgi:diaminopimelate epimerase
MTTLCLTKHHGLGNDFLVLLDMDAVHPLTAELTRALCDRHRGIGADGVIRATRPGPDAGRETSGSAVLRFELRNADGSEAEMSGNGMRCLAQAAYGAGLVAAGQPFVVLTPAGPRAVTVRPTEAPGMIWASVEMGTPVVDESAEVGAGRLRVNVGNPHLVILAPAPATLDTVAVGIVGAGLDRDEPGGLNVEWVSLGPGPDEATMRVWERGVGETLACGTGACAVAVALRHWGDVGQRVTVNQPGGAAEVQLRDDGSVALAGPSLQVGLIEVRIGDLTA